MKSLIAHIIILSRRRPGEVVRATVENYKSVDDNDNIAGLKQIISSEEKRNGDELHIFHVTGKNTRKVPCLLTGVMKKSLDSLLDKRKYIGIKENKLLFARPDSSLYYNGSKIIDDIKNNFKLRNHKHFTATGLRHHVATFSQILGDTTYTENLATFMGHDLSIHKANYRLPLAVVQKTVVGQQLLKMTVPNESPSQNSLLSLAEEKGSQIVSDDDADYIPDEDEECNENMNVTVKKKKMYQNQME